MKVKSLSRVRLPVTPSSIAYQASPSTGFSRQEYWSGLPLPSPGDRIWVSWIAGRCFTLWATRSTQENQTSQVKEFSAFLCMRRCKSLDSLKSFLWCAPQFSGARIPCFRSQPEFRRAYCGEWLQSDGCWMAGVLSFLSPRRAHYPWWLQLLRIVTFFVHWYGRKYSISQYYFHFMDKVTEVKQSQKTW